MWNEIISNKKDVYVKPHFDIENRFKGDNIEAELLAKEAISLITEKSFTEGLTDKVKEFLESKTKEE